MMNKETKRKLIVYPCNVGTVLCLCACVLFGAGIVHNIHAKDEYNQEVASGKIMPRKEVNRLNKQSKGFGFGISSTPHSRQVLNQVSQMNNHKANLIQQVITQNGQSSVTAQKKAYDVLHSGSDKTMSKNKHYIVVQTNVDNDGSAKAIAKIGEDKMSNVIKSTDTDVTQTTSNGCAVSNHGSQTHIVYVFQLNQHNIEK